MESWITIRYGHVSVRCIQRQRRNLQHAKHLRIFLAFFATSSSPETRKDDKLCNSRMSQEGSNILLSIELKSNGTWRWLQATMPDTFLVSSEGYSDKRNCEVWTMGTDRYAALCHCYRAFRVVFDGSLVDVSLSWCLSEGSILGQI